MGAVIIQALYFFLPSYVANAAPVFLDKFRLFEFLAIPVDFNCKLAGMPLFGKSKTWRGIIGGIAGALIIIFLQALIFAYYGNWANLYIFPYGLPQILLLGVILGAGEGLGDLFKSFIKRRLNIKSSAPFFPFDQMSFLGALIPAYFFYSLPAGHAVIILLVSPLIPVVANLIAYKTGWKKVWW